MIKKLIFILLVAMCASGAYASGANIVLCQEKDRNCQVIPIDDAKHVEKISHGTILRITFAYGKILDVQIAGKVFEIKKNKRNKSR